MSKTFRPGSPRQSFLLPPSPLEWLPQDHLAHFILDVVCKGRRGDELPAERARAQGRREVIREALRALEAEAKSQAPEEARDDEDEPPTAGGSGLPTHRIPVESDGTPKEKAQGSGTAHRYRQNEA